MLKLRKKATKTEIGRQFEEKAAYLLQKSGFTIVTKNYRCKNGEIDIIAKSGSLLVFVEVKARSTDSFGYSSQFVNLRKLKRVISCAKQFMQKNKLDDVDIRFDIIGFDGDKTEWIKNITMEEY